MVQQVGDHLHDPRTPSHLSGHSDNSGVSLSTAYCVGRDHVPHADSVLPSVLPSGPRALIQLAHGAARSMLCTGHCCGMTCSCAVEAIDLV